MWQDMIYYWAWRGKEPYKNPPPTVKKLVYAKIHYPQWYPEPMTMTICCGVFDDGRYTPVGLDEIN